MVKPKKNETERPPSVYRCDKLPTFMNAAKTAKVKAMLKSWRSAAKSIADIQWNCFYRDGRFDPFFDPATVHRKNGAGARRTILRLIHNNFDIPVIAPEKNARQRLPVMIPGLSDILAPLKARLGAAEVQMVQGQVLGTLNSYVSNRQNDFVAAVFGSTLKEERHHPLFVINRTKAWFDLGRPLHIDGVPIPSDDRRLARKIMSSIMARHRFPRFSNIGMVVDKRILSLETARKTKSFDLWLNLKVGRGDTIRIPLREHDHSKTRKGQCKTSYQIVEDRETGAISVGVVTDVADAFAVSREAYSADAGGPVAMDFGLKTMFATDQGDLLGRGFLTKLAALDGTIAGIARHVQRAGKKPRTSKRYVAHVDRVRGFITTEINRVINRLIAVRKPSRLFLERLDFRSPTLSRRMNRIVQNCGRAVLRAKLQAIKEEFGVETTLVVSAYTSQTCSCCGYVDKRNRDAQRFECGWCGNKMHADVNAGRNVGSERFRSLPPLRPGFRKAVLDILVTRHAERNERRRGSPSDPRETNPYFEDWKPQVRSLPLAA